jgi:UDP-N-acetylglucosamine 4-epimerase
MMRGAPVHINGDEETSRDFCYVENAIQVNLLAALASDKHALNEVYNVAVGGRTTLKQLFELIRGEMATHLPALAGFQPVFRDFRPGDVRHSQADIGKAHRLLGYEPTHDVRAGLAETVRWFLKNSSSAIPVISA